MNLSTVEQAIAEIRAGKLVLVADDEDRENEGDLICSAQLVTPALVNFMIKRAGGLICLALTADRCSVLDLPQMSEANTEERRTAFTVSIDAAPRFGVTTGISAQDRSRTIQVAVDPASAPGDLRRPGHVFPLRAYPGGVLQRVGHTEAAVDLARLAGLNPSGVICEVLDEHGEPAKRPWLEKFVAEHNLAFITVAELVAYRLQNERLVHRIAEARLPTELGEWQIVGYRNDVDNHEHVALVFGDVRGPSEAERGTVEKSVLVRMHSRCLTGDVFHSMRCDCGWQLHTAMQMIAAEGRGVVVYLDQEGRGIGLLNKLKAYELQDTGIDTVEANEQLGFKPDLRNYGIGAQILLDLGLTCIRPMTNNPRKLVGLEGYGLRVESRVPIAQPVTAENRGYLDAKRSKLGHLFAH
ncbi:MAG: bifunctional 3,4-dihydroxy-2-butanone-4-phosphate synthase/GTP cyclohydrolase II [Gemmatimonadaceae bacterium]